MSGLDDLDTEAQTEAFRDLANEYNRSLDRQMESVKQIQDKALEVVKINFLVIGALVAGSSVFFEHGGRIGLLVTATALCFVFSTWSAVRAYSSYMFFKHGWGHGDITEIVKMRSLSDYYHITALSLDYWIGVNRVRYDKPLSAFRKGLWAALTGAFVFSFLLLKVVEFPVFEAIYVGIPVADAT